MALTYTERDLLMRAREAIVAGATPFICTALGDAVRTAEDRVAKKRLCAWIQAALSPTYCLAVWQDRCGRYVDGSQTHRDRIAWIDWMLETPV